MAAEKAIHEMTDRELRVHALSILNRELGSVGFARYLRIKSPGEGDYTRDRHLWLDGITVEDVLSEMNSTAQRDTLVSK